MDEPLEVLPGEGDEQVVRRIRERFECCECGAPADYKATYLLPNARRNPDSKAYRRDDCSWCSDHDEFLCKACLKEHRNWHPVVDGYEPCSLFPATANFAHMFLRWREELLEASNHGDETSPRLH